MSHEFLPQQATLTQFYDRFYRGNEKHDSPDASRVSLMRKIAAYAKTHTSTRMLDIGAGRQSLEKQLLASYGNQPWISNFFEVTVDIADIPRYKLISRKTPHIQANACFLPFAESTFNIVVSNHAIDFLPPGALHEASRVLTRGGYGYFNFHHPSMLESFSRVQNPHIQSFWNYLIENNVLYGSEDEIEMVLSQSGFEPQGITLASDRHDRWWEVVVKKQE